MIGMPTAADVGLLVGPLADYGDLRVLAFEREIVIDVDPTPPFGERDMRFGGKRLVAQNGDALVPQQPRDHQERHTRRARRRYGGAEQIDRRDGLGGH